MLIQVKSPMRVDLAGGTLDCWPLNAIVGKCYTLNMSISMYTAVELKVRESKEIELDISDLDYNKTFSSLEDVLLSKDKELVLIQSHLQYWQPSRGFSLKTQSESPVGGGLGGSSSLSVTLIKAFAKMMGRVLSDLEIVQLASNIEARFLMTPTGTQDYFGACGSGVNCITYGDDGHSSHSLPVDLDVFSNSISVVNTGKSHHSGINNWQVLKAVVEDKSPEVISMLKKIAKISEEMKETIEKKKWSDIPLLLNEENEARMKLTSSFSSPQILQLQEIAKQGGASGFKVCGAGGGGCVLIWTDPTLKNKVEELCQNNGFQVLKASPFILKN